MPGPVNLLNLTEEEQANLIETRWQDSASLWSEVSSSYEKYRKIWQNNPEWLANVPNKRSKARDNRIFLATESVITTLTGRPSKPNTIPANETDEAMAIADDLQEFFLAKYRDLGLKGKVRRGLRWLFFSKLMVMKIYWDPEKDDFDVLPVDPRLVRFSPKSTSMFDTEYAIEQVPDVPLTRMLELFPEKKSEILKRTGYDEKRAMVDNPKVTYREAWINGYKLCEFMGTILDARKHPYYDFEGLSLTPNEESELGNMNGRKRRPYLDGIAEKQDGRSSGRYETYLQNHFDRPIPPYIFGTVLAVDNRPVGETSLIEQVQPLQVEIDRRKRQISDNAEMMNGKWKVDTALVEMSKADAQTLPTNPRAVIYGHGVRNGVSIETGQALPSFVVEDMKHSTIEIDNIFGTQPTFRGEGGQEETATGRSILREQSFNRLDEMVDLVDNIHLQLYAWMFQMMRVRYTEAHLIKPIGAEKSRRAIELTRNDLQDGIEINIIPGQIMPEDRVFKAERAKEEAVAGLIDPLTYFEETQRDNPAKLAKRLEMYKINPFSIIKLDPEDMKAIAEAAQMFAPQGAEGAQEGEKAAQVQDLRMRVEDLTGSPEFQSMPDGEKQQAMAQINEQLERLKVAK